MILLQNRVIEPNLIKTSFNLKINFVYYFKAYQLFQNILGLVKQNLNLTNNGNLVSKLSVPICSGLIILKSIELGCWHDAITIASMYVVCHLLEVQEMNYYQEMKIMQLKI